MALRLVGRLEAGLNSFYDSASDCIADLIII